MKPTKDGGPYADTDQVSTCQAPGVLLWETVMTTVAGKEVFRDFRYDNHVQFIKLMTGMVLVMV